MVLLKLASHSKCDILYQYCANIGCGISKNHSSVKTCETNRYNTKSPGTQGFRRTYAVIGSKQEHLHTNYSNVSLDTP